MFKYNSIITISRQGDDVPLVKFTYYANTKDEPAKKAEKWIAENLPPERRSGVFYEIALVESEIEIFTGI